MELVPFAKVGGTEGVPFDGLLSSLILKKILEEKIEVPIVARVA